jgi:hypothetical protein
MTTDALTQGFIWAAYGIDHMPLSGYKQLFAFTRADAVQRFAHEYGADATIAYLVGDTFSYWASLELDSHGRLEIGS